MSWHKSKIKIEKLRKKAGKAPMSWVARIEAWGSAVKWSGGGKTLLSRAIRLRLKSERTLLSLMKFFRESTTISHLAELPFYRWCVRNQWQICLIGGEIDIMRPSRLIAWFSGQLRSTTLATNHVRQSSNNLSRFWFDSWRLGLMVVYASMDSLAVVNASWVANT